LWDRTVVPTFASSAGSTISSTAITSINYLHGKVTFGSTQGTSPTARSGTYIPLTTVGGGFSYTLTQAHDDLDDTDFDVTDGYRSHKLGLKDIQVSVNRWYANDLTFFNAVNGRTPVVIEVQPGGAGEYARGYFHTLSENVSGDVSALEQSDLEFVVDGSTTATYAWNDE
jgi:hypothetical protein